MRQSLLLFLALSLLAGATQCRNFLQLIAMAPNVTYGFAAPSQAVNRQGAQIIQPARKRRLPPLG
jgi:hypothetical protein